MKNLRKLCWLWLAGFAISVLVEIVGFNYRSLESLSFQEITDASVAGSVENGKIIVEISYINAKVHNLLLDFDGIFQGNKSEYKITLWAVDEGSELYYSLPEIKLKKDDPASKFVKLNLNGIAKRIKIVFTNMKPRDISLDKVKLNVHRPFMISWKRILSIFFFLHILFLFRPSSFIYQRNYLSQGHRNIFLCGILISLQILLTVYVTFTGPGYREEIQKQPDQYATLAKSLAQGHFYLNTEPSDKLKAMKNPYDLNMRISKNVPYLWDRAYYEGKYYVYFGVMPVLFFYLPYYLLTGQNLMSVYATLICEIGFLLGLFFLIHGMVKRYFPKVSLGIFLLINIIAFLCCGILIIAKLCIFYVLPIIMALCMTVWGLYFWVSAYSDTSIRWGRVFVGCCCMAFISGCRPQLLLACFLGFPLLWNPIRQSRKAKGGKWKFFLCLLPFIFVGLGLMYYNYSRFGSPFDFGANYNLTTNDMTKRGWHLDRIPFGLFSFLFQPPSFSAQFPWIQAVPMITHYQGVTIHEKMFGGIFMLHPLLWTNLLLFPMRNRLRKQKCLLLGVLSLIFAFIIAIADIQMAGIVLRYLCDFGIFLCIPMIFILFSLEELLQNSKLTLVPNNSTAK